MYLIKLDVQRPSTLVPLRNRDASIRQITSPLVKKVILLAFVTFFCRGGATLHFDGPSCEYCKYNIWLTS